MNLKNILLTLSLLLVILAAGCSLPGMDEETGEATPTPDIRVPYALKNEEYLVISNPACTLGSQPVILPYDMQGNLTAWAPPAAGGDETTAPVERLALIRATSKDTWFQGELVVVDGPTFDVPRVLAEHAHGYVTWSPDGDQLAYVSYRKEDEQYTVMLVEADGQSKPYDLFPGQQAATAPYTSRKAILQWNSPSEMIVLSSCGAGCSLVYRVNPITRQAEEIPADGVDMQYAWQIRRNETPPDQGGFPVMLEPNWSPDGNGVTFLDARYNLFVLLAEQKEIFAIYWEGAYLPVTFDAPEQRETAWSSTGKLAVRLEDRVEIYDPYDPTCRNGSN